MSEDRYPYGSPEAASSNPAEQGSWRTGPTARSSWSAPGASAGPTAQPAVTPSPLPVPALELARQHGIVSNPTPQGVAEVRCTEQQLQAFAQALVTAERARIVPIVAGLYTPGHWSGPGVLRALEQITGTSWHMTQRGEPEGLDWSDA